MDTLHSGSTTSDRVRTSPRSSSAESVRWSWNNSSRFTSVFFAASTKSLFPLTTTPPITQLTHTYCVCLRKLFVMSALLSERKLFYQRVKPSCFCYDTPAFLTYNYLLTYLLSSDYASMITVFVAECLLIFIILLHYITFPFTILLRDVSGSSRWLLWLTSLSVSNKRYL